MGHAHLQRRLPGEEVHDGELRIRGRIAFDHVVPARYAVGGGADGGAERLGLVDGFAEIDDLADALRRSVVTVGRGVPEAGEREQAARGGRALEGEPSGDPGRAIDPSHGEILSGRVQSCAASLLGPGPSCGRGFSRPSSPSMGR